jgi:hypothetical protein
MQQAIAVHPSQINYSNMEEEAYSEYHLTHQPSLLIDMLKFNRSLTKNKNTIT